MTLATLTNKYEASVIEYVFHLFYSRIDEFVSVYSQLLALKSEPVDSVIFFEKIKEDNGDKYLEIVTYPKNEKSLVDNDFEYYDSSYQDWDWWLGCEIDEDVLTEYSEQEIICHVLWEMTFLGARPEVLEQSRKQLFESEGENDD